MTLSVVILLPILIGLGFWQLDRAAEKRAIRDRVLAREGMAAVEVNRTRLDPETMTFRRATARGRYRPELSIYLDNKVLNGVPGYDVVTPLVLTSSGKSGGGGPEIILVNRGWVGWGDSRQTLPTVDTPASIVTTEGWLTRPPEDYFTLEAPSNDKEFKPRWQNLDLERYRKITGLPVAPLVLDMAPGADDGSGLVRSRPEYDDSWIERHKAYAVQWFGLALTLVVIYVVLNFRKRSPDE